MSNKKQLSQFSKYYHNDIKKQLGIDQTRTASQKLLDKVIKVDKRADFYLLQNHQQQQQLNSQPKKKIKPNPQSQQTSQQQSNFHILQNKLFKNIQNQTNLNKLIKSLTILKKCLNQQAFINDEEINFKQKWQLYTDKLLNQINERNIYSGESFTIMAMIGDCVEMLCERFDSKGNNIGGQQYQASQQNEAKQQQPNKIKDDNNKNDINTTLKNIAIINKQQVWVSFCRLFMDDSFVFSKHLNILKQIIFSHFDGSLKPENQIKQQVLTLINKLVTFPVKTQWAHAQIIKLFKDFNNNGYQNQLQQSYKKSYLKSYNQFLNKKPKSSTADGGSYNMMGGSNQTNGLKTVHIETTQQNSSDKWVSKQ